MLDAQRQGLNALAFFYFIYSSESIPRWDRGIFLNQEQATKPRNMLRRMRKFSAEGYLNAFSRRNRAVSSHRLYANGICNKSVIKSPRIERLRRNFRGLDRKITRLLNPLFIRESGVNPWQAYGRFFGNNEKITDDYQHSQI